MQPSDESPEDYLSKSEIKRRMHKLQNFGEQLLRLGDNALAKLPLSDKLRKALAEGKRIPSRGAGKRHLQYIGKLMRDEDAEAIAHTLEQIEAGSVAEKKQLHHLEQWRDRLIDQGDEALSQLIETYPHADLQHLRHLIRTAQKEREQAKPPAAGRKLFRYLRETLN